MLDQVRGRLRLRHYSLRTEQAYVGWIRRFILANGKRHPAQMGQAEVEAFLTELAMRGQVSAGTQNQALAALLFLYREVLGAELPWMETLVRAKRPRGIPVRLRPGVGTEVPPAVRCPETMKTAKNPRSSWQCFSRPGVPCPAPHPYPRWSPATHTPSMPW